jgi:hypothetical protein
MVDELGLTDQLKEKMNEHAKDKRKAMTAVMADHLKLTYPDELD